MPTLTVFPADGADGRARAERIAAIGRDLGYDHIADRDAERDRARHPVFHPRFWDELRLDPRALGAGDGARLTVADLLGAETNPDVIRLSHRRAQRLAASGEELRQGGVRLRVRRFEPRLLWEPLRHGAALGGRLRSLATFYADA